MHIPAGFRPVTFTQLLEETAQVPQLATGLYEHLGVDQFAARAKIAQLEKADLIQFAMVDQIVNGMPLQRHGKPPANAIPSVFAAPPKDFTSESDHAFTSKLVSYWDQQGQFDARTGQIAAPEDITAELTTPEALHRMETPAPDARDLASISLDSTVIIETPEGKFILTGTVAKRLLDLHLLTLENGILRAPSKAQLVLWTEEHGICDFCSDPTPKHTVMVPDFTMLVDGPHGDEMSMGGWRACDPCYTMIKEDRRADLLRRSIESSGGGRFTAAARDGLHRRFWKLYDAKIEAAGIGMGLTDFIEDRVAPEAGFVNPALQDKNRRREAIRRMTGLSQDEMEAMERGNVLHKETVQKLQTWRKRYGLESNSPEGQRRITEFLNSLDRPLPPSHVPHWQEALDRKVEAYDYLRKLTQFAGPGADQDTILDIKGDVAGLKLAEVYSFNADTIHAILAGAKSIPHESTLKSVEIPAVRAGWFWFGEPLALASAPISSDRTHALLWGWEPNAPIPTMRFSAYVVDEKGVLDHARRGEIRPSAKWYWPVDYSFHDMIGMAHVMYQRAYGPGSPESPGKETAVGEKQTLHVIAEMSLFFLMSCLWFRQTVPGSKKKIEPKLTQTDGHIERHARKRYEKEFKVKPSVRVIALRKTERVPSEDRPEPGASGRKMFEDYHIVVSGHAKLQPCGPGHKDRKLIWVDPFPKGNLEAPFKESSAKKVFAVVR